MKNSRLPSPPGIADGTIPPTRQPSPLRKAPMSLQTAVWTAGSRTMPFLTSRRPASNCGLISARSVARSFEDFADSRQDELERDEAHIDRGEIRLFGKPRRIDAADIGFFHRDDVAAAAQARMKLIAADVDGVDAPRAAHKQDFGEAAGRGADVEADAPGHVEMKMIERGRKLDAAARHIRMRRARRRCPRRRRLPPTPCAPARRRR